VTTLGAAAREHTYGVTPTTSTYAVNEDYSTQRLQWQAGKVYYQYNSQMGISHRCKQQVGV